VAACSLLVVDLLGKGKSKEKNISNIPQSNTMGSTVTIHDNQMPRNCWQGKPTASVIQHN